jgi:hypothetical protein
MIALIITLHVEVKKKKKLFQTCFFFMFAIQKEYDNHIDHYLHPIQEQLKWPKLSQACSFFYFIISSFFFSLSLCYPFFLFIANHKECNDHVDHHPHSIQSELGRPKFF